MMPHPPGRALRATTGRLLQSHVHWPPAAPAQPSWASWPITEFSAAWTILLRVAPRVTGGSVGECLASATRQPWTFAHWNKASADGVSDPMQALRWLIFLALVLGIAGCDHATKVIAATALPEGHSVPLIASVLSLEQARNTDTGFSLLSGIVPIGPRLLLLKTTATLGAFFIAALALVRFRGAPKLERIGLACMLGGAVGNAVDRWRWGYVVDFIRFEYWPTFNIADVALCVGGGLLLRTAITEMEHANAGRSK